MSDVAFFRMSLVVWIVLNIILGFVGNYPTLHLPAAIGSLAFWFFTEVTLFVFKCIVRIPRMTIKFKDQAAKEQAMIDAIIEDAKKGTVFTPPKKPRPLGNQYLVDQLDQLAEKGFAVEEFVFLTEAISPQTKTLTLSLRKVKS